MTNGSYHADRSSWKAGNHPVQSGRDAAARALEQAALNTHYWRQALAHLHLAVGTTGRICHYTDAPAGRGEHYPPRRDSKWGRDTMYQFIEVRRTPSDGSFRYVALGAAIPIQTKREAIAIFRRSIREMADNPHIHSSTVIGIWREGYTRPIAVGLVGLPGRRPIVGEDGTPTYWRVLSHVTYR